MRMRSIIQSSLNHSRNRAVRNRVVIVGQALLLALALIFASTQRAAQAQPAAMVKILEATYQSNFRRNVIFSVKARSDGPKIVSAALLQQDSLSNSVQRNPLPAFEPATDVELQYEWNTAIFTTPPWQVFSYFWEFTDEAGQKFRSERYDAEFADTSRAWQKRDGNGVSIYTYDLEATKVAELLSASERGVAQTAQRTGFTASTNLRVVLFNSQTDFCTMYVNCTDWIGGQSYGLVFVAWWGPALNGSSAVKWDAPLLEDLIPHELSHCFLTLEMSTRGSSRQGIPVWFDEGQAMNNESAVSIAQSLKRTRELAQAGALPRLAEMEARTTISRNQLDAVGDWYAIASSLVTFLYERYDPTVLGKLVSSVMEGRSFEEALQQVTGLTLLELEAQWRSWLGVTATLPPPGPTDTPFAFRPAPTYPPAPTKQP